MIEKWSILAGMRFLLASIVVMGHLHEHAPSPWGAVAASFGSFEAILGFLLISGYSIGHSYQVKPEGFLLRRVKRLYPVYLFSLVLCVVLGNVGAGHAPDIPWLKVLLNALLLNQLFTTESYLGPAWSLALEFWLYCLAPLLIAWSDRRVRGIMFGSLACYVFYSTARPFFSLPYFAALGFGLNLPLLAFSWVAGLRLARQDVAPQGALRDAGLIFAGHWLLSAGLQGAYRLKNHALDIFLTADLPGLLARAITLFFVWWVFRRFVIPCAETEGSKSMSLRFLGDVSYPLYLLHVPVIMFLAARGWHSPLLIYFTAILASALAYRLLDSYSRKRHLS